MLKVAILGANGFIGSRTVELLHLAGLADVRPIVRTVNGMARLSRFDLDCRVADAFDTQALRTAFAGCDVIVHAIAGDTKTILETLTPTYQAAQQAGVGRIVYLSTASVHGQAPAPGIDETALLSDQQPIAYNNAKVRAERLLLDLCEQGSVELVMLRPGIVFGPRASWITNIAADLLAGSAYLVNQGQGICNSIYVDNLIYAIYLALSAPSADRHAFFVGDREQVTWLDFYRPIAEALGRDVNDIARVSYTPAAHVREWKRPVQAMIASRPSQTVLALLPKRLRQAGGIALLTLMEAQPLTPESSSAWAFPKQQPATTKPTATLEMALLHRCQYKLPYTKARKLLGYEPVVAFHEACRRSIAWLAFAGYPVVEAYKQPESNLFSDIQAEVS